MIVCVVGGGPAGLLASFGAASQGAKVILVEKNDKVGKKIYITGKGRCNVTNTASYDEFLQNVVVNQKFVMSVLHQFSPQDAMSLIEENGTRLKTERGGRVFPVSDKASDITKALIKACEKAGVEFRHSFEVEDIKRKDLKYVVVSKTNAEIVCDRLVLATGGKSYTATGSTGEGFVFAEKLGHHIVPLVPALVPIKLKNKFVKDLEGISLKNVRLSAYNGTKCVKSFFGEMLFTSVGISGPIALSMSSYINKEKEDVALSIDFKPSLSFEQLDKRLQRDFADNKNKNIMTVAYGLLPRKVAEVFITVANVSPDKKINSITKEERTRIISLLKDFRLDFNGLYSLDCAIITSGGVLAKEICPKTMKSKIVDNLFFAGEMIDVDCLTGGFNIQIAMSTGYVAGKNAGNME